MTAARGDGMQRERGPLDDLKWALAVLAGFVIGTLVFDADWSVLVGAVIGVAVVVAVRTLLRRRRAARRT